MKSNIFQLRRRARSASLILTSLLFAVVLRAQTPSTNSPPVEKAPTADMLPGKGPAQKGDWFDKVWGQRRAQFRADRDASQGALVFLGDSITQGWGDLRKHFPEY